MENLARYVVRASFSQERMTYLPDESKVGYRSKAYPRPRSGNGENEKTFDALEWLAAMCSHVPNKGEQMVRYYGYYTNVSRGERKRMNEDTCIPCILEAEGSSIEHRKNWARLIQKIYEVDPFTCPRRHRPMCVISFIEDKRSSKRSARGGQVLNHLGLWEVNPPYFWRVKPRPPPRMAKAQPLYTEPWSPLAPPQVNPGSIIQTRKSPLPIMVFMLGLICS